ncbi:phosphatases II [Mycena floridula]|nr:phosphatases II [Mycena floridula]
MIDFIDWQLHNPTEFMNSFNTPMHEILPATANTGSLHLGSITALIEPQNLQDKDILCVLGLVMLETYPLDNDPRFDTCVVSIHDMDDRGAELREKLPGLCDWIKERISQNRNVLVHCHAGMSRSASVVIAYLIREQDMSYEQAVRFVWSRRNCINPNPGFVGVLKHWETECRGAGK